MTIGAAKRLYNRFIEGELETVSKKEYQALVLYLKHIELLDLYQIDLDALTISD